MSFRDDSQARSLGGAATSAAAAGAGVAGSRWAAAASASASSSSSCCCSCSAAAGASGSSATCRTRLPRRRRASRRPLGLPSPAPMRTPARTAASSATSTRCSASGRTSSRAAGAPTCPPTTYFESGQWQTGCGRRAPTSGPFYCPADKHVYIDLGFLDELHDRFGATGGLARAGLRDRARVRPPRAGSPRHARPAAATRPARRAVRAHRAAGRLLRGRVGRARDRDRPAGADHAGSRSPTRSTRRRPSATIASRSRRRARSTRDTWTHGSSAQRKTWFTTGYQTGDMTKCDTFGGSI